MTDESLEATTGETTEQHLVYTPILRDGPSERDVIRQFGGLSRFTEDRRGKLYPLLEVTDASDLENLGLYADPADKLLIDAPQYLTQDENELTESVEELLDESGGPIEFLNSHTDSIPVPVVSGTVSNPITYFQYLNLYRDVSNDFDRVALRLFVRPNGLTDTQREDLDKLKNLIGQDDLVLLDILEVAQLGIGDEGRETLRKLCDIFDRQSVIILNPFSSHEGENYNFGPDIARDLNATGFGDFAINYRFPESVPLGNIDTRIIRQYSPTNSEVHQFRGNGYSEAFEELEAWELWDPTHCEFCRRAEAEDTEDLRFWKRVRTGHYIYAALYEEAV